MGRVIPTEEGALSPDGFTGFLGRPPILPPAARRDTVAETPAPEATTDAAPDQTSASETPASETPAPEAPASPDAPASEAPKLSKRARDRQRAPLTVHVPREQLEDGTSRDVPSLEYWSLPARQPRGNRKGGRPQGGRNQGGNNKFRKPKGGQQNRNRGSGGSDYSAGKAPRPRKSLENSPFAALAALQTGKDKKDDS
jgi:hypothetical protein